ncbi:DUF3106 domain-containing protein [Massilia niabensis]|uniref:DUF3106 domain-containing protein n=1 Tax=Massilia niabensis TaxID=544910 RepID=A0ABW0L9I3_9BURK
MTTPHSKPRRAGLIAVAALLLAALAAWFVWEGARDGAQSAAPGSSSSGAAAGMPGKGGPQLFHKPLWKDLSGAQQLALQPLKDEWDVMEGTRKRKWLEMSRRFASMSPAEQERVHERMRQWVRLTPEQRTLARENFTRTRKLAPGEKTANWENYKQLTPDQKRRLAQTRKSPPSASPPASPIIVAPTSCPPGTTRRGASCMSLQAPASIPSAPAITQPAPAPAAPASSTTQPTAAPTASNANG